MRHEYSGDIAAAGLRAWARILWENVMGQTVGGRPASVPFYILVSEVYRPGDELARLFRVNPPNSYHRRGEDPCGYGPSIYGEWPGSGEWGSIEPFMVERCVQWAEVQRLLPPLVSAPIGP